MRPVTKWPHSDPAIQPIIQEEYRPYGDAKTRLEDNIGSYCSYCERVAEDEAAHVEHILPKSLRPDLMFKWDNFLLSCARCNGTDNKSNKLITFADVHLPHLNNTLISIFYGEGGFVQANVNLHNKALDNAEALIRLVGLDKRPGHPEFKAKDKRWQRRRTVWEQAQRYLQRYQDSQIDEQTIIDLAQATGFWSVWYSTFQNFEPIRRALVENFKGTARDCFDAEYKPLPRNPTNSIDII